MTIDLHQPEVGLALVLVREFGRAAVLASKGDNLVAGRYRRGEDFWFDVWRPPLANRFDFGKWFGTPLVDGRNAGVQRSDPDR